MTTTYGRIRTYIFRALFVHPFSFFLSLLSVNVCVCLGHMSVYFESRCAVTSAVAEVHLRKVHIGF